MGEREEGFEGERGEGFPFMGLKGLRSLPFDPSTLHLPLLPPSSSSLDLPSPLLPLPSSLSPFPPPPGRTRHWPTRLWPKIGVFVVFSSLANSSLANVVFVCVVCVFVCCVLCVVCVLFVCV